MSYILAIDQGTSSSRCIIYDRQAQAVASAQQEFPQYFPQPGWVEHDPKEIWRSQMSACQHAMAQLRLQASDIAAIGITNQRETVLLWDRNSGEPVHNAIVWQDRRTSEFCAQLQAQGHEPVLRAKTGLALDPYFSASKLRWLLDHVPGARQRAERGELAFGTVDTWLVWQLSGGGLHITDVSNASRTLLYDIHRLRWDEGLLALFDIPAAILPEVRASCEAYGTTRCPELGDGIVLAAIAGDQQAALFGQLCHSPGMVKCTYGTGAFLMLNTGTQAVASQHRLLTTIAWQIGGEVHYALEGSAFVAGAAIQWLRDGLRLFAKTSECEALAASVADNGGVYFVPALTGLGAPYWDAQARGAIFGLTRGSDRAHLARAALESIAYQVDDLLRALADDSAGHINALRIDGGAAGNNLLAQFQADISRLEVLRPGDLESTALGAAYLAGLAVGFWDWPDLRRETQPAQCFRPQLPETQADHLRQQWQKAVARSLAWAE